MTIPTPTRPVLRWHGGKWRLAPWIIGHFPMATVIIEHKPALDLLSLYDRTDALFYCDPPYLGVSPHYHHEMTEADHFELLDAITRLQGMVVLSGYPTPLYDDALTGWLRVETGALADGARPRTEVLWINPACAGRLAAQQASLFEAIS